MKTTYCLLFLLIFSCSPVKKHTITVVNKPGLELSEKYKVIKIDSIKNVYVVYAKKELTLYKIVSLKDWIACRNIQVGGEYPFKLMSRVPKDFKGIDISPNTIPHITGIDFYGTWIEFESDSINDIFISFNLKGLCIQ
jgi:hypothetical protein